MNQYLIFSNKITNKETKRFKCDSKRFSDSKRFYCSYVLNYNKLNNYFFKIVVLYVTAKDNDIVAGLNVFKRRFT